MRAAILALQMDYVDIVTSSPILARRDAEDKRFNAFFKMLGLTVAHNVDEEQFVRYRHCYEANVLYGYLGSFQGDWLRQKFKGHVSWAHYY